MPFRSEAQRRLLWLKHPKIARRWANEYDTKEDLPMKVENMGIDKHVKESGSYMGKKKKKKRGY